jgi:hypothetical protein
VIPCPLGLKIKSCLDKEASSVVGVVSPKCCPSSSLSSFRPKHCRSHSLVHSGGHTINVVGVIS